jgi:uncharacterized membrane protein
MTLARIFCVRWFRIAAYITTVLSVMWALGTIIMILTICQPLPKFWNYAMPGKCGDLVNILLLFGALDVVLDVIIMLLPIPMVYQLQMPFANKIGLAAIFAMGLL